MTVEKGVLAELATARTTAANDDYSKPGTIERERHCQRLSAMHAATDEIVRLAALAQQPRPEQEAVAWRVRPIGDKGWHLSHDPPRMGYEGRALVYATPAPAPAPSAGLSPDDAQLLHRLKIDNRHDGARPVIEGDQAVWDQAMQLSADGMIAIEQLAMGGRLHITRLGVAALARFMAPAKAAPASETLPADVVRLVIAARTFAYSDPFPEDRTELDKALEAFADRVQWEDEPASETEGKS